MTTKKKLLAAFKLLISVALIVALYRRIDFVDLAARMRGVAWLPLWGFFALLFFNTAISTVKWHILLRADAVDLPYRTLLGSYLVGTFFNVFLPSNIGGDAVRIYDVARHSDRPINSFASVFADRLSGFIALSVFGLVFPLAGWKSIAEPRLLFFPLAAFALFIGMAWALWRQTPVRWALSLPGLRRMTKLQAMAETFLASITAYRRRPRVLAKIMAVSFLFQFCVIVAVFLLAHALRLDIPFFPFCVFVPLISLLEAIPVTIYGVGLRDSGYVFFLTQIGHTRADAAALSLLYVAATLAYCSLGGIVFALRRGSRTTDSPKSTEGEA